ncbi:replication endonuclease [uncultured Paraglaciecola sp.]|uniref:replication endonuclease n=1 Tax=uncultured Paraglaciecola sp. TaxID=1765024 RepID=UPI0030DC0EB4
MDAGSTPASSTKLNDGLDPSRPSHPFHTKAYSHNPLAHLWVYKSPDKSSEWLKYVIECREADTYSDRITQGIGTKECRKFRAKFFQNHLPVCNEVAREYLRISEKADYIQANLFLLEIEKHSLIDDLNLVDSQNHHIFAEEKSKICARFKRTFPERFAHKLSSQLMSRYKLGIPANSDISVNLNMLCCEDYWLKKIRVASSRAIEQVRRMTGIINKSKGIYCSDTARDNWRWHKEQSQEYLENTFIENEDGQTFSLADIAKTNVSNPAIRRCEMMTRIRGFEEVAEFNGDVGDFYTITTPSKMHSHSTTGIKNYKYDNTTSKQANNYLCNVWARIRAKLEREQIKIYGIRVSEPHHDGTPHWHLLLFTAPEFRKRSREIIQHYAMQEDGKEAGAEKHRYKCVPIDPAKGDAAGYIAKYVAKNIDGEFIKTDSYGNEAKSSAQRITAWANLNGIRQFQFIGGPSVTLWRQLRRAEAQENQELEACRMAADASNWAAYVMLMGGINKTRLERPIQLEYDLPPSDIDYETGELVFRTGRYGQSLSSQITGFKIGNNFVPIKRKLWTIKPSPPDDDCPLAHTCANGQSSAGGRFDLGLV